MQAWVPVVGMIGLALVVGTTIVLAGPLGKALAAWIRGWSAHDAAWLAAHAPPGSAEAERLRTVVDALERRLAEVEDRLDFAERLLAQTQESERLVPPR
ncbi:MAG TPA: hypothetical protein VEU55_08320 [Gemmatimonadales bacterium]|nr:hypothetical protein [Gemmatimonadales bacterium]